MGECSIEATDAGSGRLKGSTSAVVPARKKHDAQRFSDTGYLGLITVKVVNCSAHVSEEMLVLESRR